MDSIVVIPIEQLTTIIEDAVSKCLRHEKPKESEQDRISGTKAAVDFLNSEGYEISSSLFTKEVAKGVIPCQRFQNKRLLFSKKELIAWAESKCSPIGQSNATLISVFIEMVRLYCPEDLAAIEYDVQEDYQNKLANIQVQIKKIKKDDVANEAIKKVA